ncbi:MAG: LrgB family protein [Treponema sp.]|nr:LrgB family protein [Treponema sp.]
METLLSLPICGILITIVCYMAGLFIRKKISSPLTSPMITSNALIILIVVFSPLTLEQYLAGGNIITMFIGPVTVILALHIYRQRTLLRKNIIPVLGGCIAGSSASLFSIWALCRLFNLEQIITASILPKSVTTAIAIELSLKGGGFAGLAVSGVIITGVTCSAFAPFFIRIFKLKDPVAAGVAIGSSGHAIGTAAAIELGEVEGAMSGLSMSLMGIVTSVIYLFLF